MGRKGYDPTFRIKAVNLANEIGCYRASSILGVSAVVLFKWKKLPLSGDRMKKELSPELKAALLEADKAKKELKVLKKENEELKTANLILREISTVFSKGPLNSNLKGPLNLKKKK